MFGRLHYNEILIRLGCYFLTEFMMSVLRGLYENHTVPCAVRIPTRNLGHPDNTRVKNVILQTWKIASLTKSSWWMCLGGITTYCVWIIRNTLRPSHSSDIWAPPHKSKDRFQPQANPCGIYGGHSGTGTCFLHALFGVPVYYPPMPDI